MIESNMNDPIIYTEPYVFVDEVSGTTKYTGTSCSFSNGGEPIWRIKKEWKVGTVTYMGFPDGSQEFAFKWNDRAILTYK